jgi:hypothetical protein
MSWFFSSLFKIFLWQFVFITYDSFSLFRRSLLPYPSVIGNKLIKLSFGNNSIQFIVFKSGCLLGLIVWIRIWPTFQLFNVRFDLDFYFYFGLIHRCFLLRWCMRNVVHLASSHTSKFGADWWVWEGKRFLSVSLSPFMVSPIITLLLAFQGTCKEGTQIIISHIYRRLIHHVSFAFICNLQTALLWWHPSFTIYLLSWSAPKHSVW